MALEICCPAFVTSFTIFARFEFLSLEIGAEIVTEAKIEPSESNTGAETARAPMSNS